MTLIKDLSDLDLEFAVFHAAEVIHFDEGDELRVKEELIRTIASLESDKYETEFDFSALKAAIAEDEHDFIYCIMVDARNALRDTA